jgi:hypothetical protein
VEAFDCDYFEDPFRGCAHGHHIYRLIELGPDGTDEGATYRCEDCGSTDPEGDSAGRRV